MIENGKPTKVAGRFGTVLDAKDGAPGVWRVAEIVGPTGLWITHSDAQGSRESAERVALKCFIGRTGQRDELTALAACRAAVDWAKTPGEHGGNPYCKEFVKLARRALGEDI